MSFSTEKIKENIEIFEIFYIFSGRWCHLHHNVQKLSFQFLLIIAPLYGDLVGHHFKIEKLVENNRMSSLFSTLLTWLFSIGSESKPKGFLTSFLAQ